MSKQQEQKQKGAAKRGETRSNRRASNQELRGVVNRGERPDRWTQQAAMQERQRF